MSATAMAIIPVGGVVDPKLLYLLQGALVAARRCRPGVVRRRVLDRVHPQSGVAGRSWVVRRAVALVLVVGGAGAASTKDVYFYAGFAGFIGFVIWIVITAILMLRAPSPATASPSQMASAT